MPAGTTDIYIADTIGELGLIFSLAPLAFVGGSLCGRGGQNPIEAIRFDTTVITGPDQSNFAESYRALRRASGVIEVANETELAGTVSLLLRDQVERARIGTRSDCRVGDALRRPAKNAR